MSVRWKIEVWWWSVVKEEEVVMMCSAVQRAVQPAELRAAADRECYLT